MYIHSSELYDEFLCTQDKCKPEVTKSTIVEPIFRCGSDEAREKQYTNTRADGVSVCTRMIHGIIDRESQLVTSAPLIKTASL